VTKNTKCLHACPAGELDDVPVEGLTKSDYKLWPLWIWIFCIIVWFIQDALKVITYYLVYKFDIFKVRQLLLPNVSPKQHINKQLWRPLA
jgi:hypothetical protein